jgi:hypothetical protein
MLRILIRYYYTIKYLKPIQIWFQIFYRMKAKVYYLLPIRYRKKIDINANPVKLVPFIEKAETYCNGNFCFLNQSKEFNKGHRLQDEDIYKIDWDFCEFGMLWTFNLNYFDFLNQNKMNFGTGIRLINSYIYSLRNRSIGNDPYTISLRGINWIKFLSNSKLNSTNDRSLEEINVSLYSQYRILFNNLEFNILANHLLENIFSLLYGAFYFNDASFYKKSEKILFQQLEEQILDDGSHFERSPMYHQIVLDRLLDCINLLKNNIRFDSQDSLLQFMLVKAVSMVSHLKEITFTNGDIPFLKDSAPGISATTKQLLEYAERLAITTDKKCILRDSGYRRFNGSNYECIIDIGNITPSYQPGHSHADTFNFVVNIANMPFIIDTGISTYEKNEHRIAERSTSAHNTVVINNYNSSDIWSGFRVGKRAKVFVIRDSENEIEAYHDGYKNYKVRHNRKWIFGEKTITIFDSTNNLGIVAIANFYSKSKIQFSSKEKIIFENGAVMIFDNSLNIKINKYKIPNGFNKYHEVDKISVFFAHHLITNIITKI